MPRLFSLAGVNKSSQDENEIRATAAMPIYLIFNFFISRSFKN
jgi:hypothetical protein